MSLDENILISIYIYIKWDDDDESMCLWLCMSSFKYICLV